jgi:hypothetical protein
VDLPAHRVKAGDFIELPGLDALELERHRAFDPSADADANRRKERVSARL